MAPRTCQYDRPALLCIVRPAHTAETPPPCCAAPADGGAVTIERSAGWAGFSCADHAPGNRAALRHRRRRHAVRPAGHRPLPRRPANVVGSAGHGGGVCYVAGVATSGAGSGHDIGQRQPPVIVHLLLAVDGVGVQVGPGERRHGCGRRQDQVVFESAPNRGQTTRPLPRGQ